MTKIVDGMFLPLDSKDIATIFDRLEREGYERSPDGVARFLIDVGAGLLDDDEDEKPSPLPSTEDILREAGERLVPAALGLIKRWRA